MKLFQIIKYSFKYRKRIKTHIKRVQHFYFELLHYGKISTQFVDIDRIMNHDKDKLKLKNLVRQALRYIPGPLTEKDKLKIHSVVMEHIRTNKHHCEYWGESSYVSMGVNCTQMEETYLYEMCADWAATSEEMGTDLMAWYNKVVNTKFIFTDKQIEIIKPICEFLSERLDKNYIRKDDMKSVKLSTLGVTND